MNTKKIFIILSIVLFLVVATLIVYNLFLKNPGDTQTSTSASPSPGVPGSPSNSPASNAAKIKALSQSKIIGATIGNDGQTIKYYDLATGDVWQTSFEGANTKKISSSNLKNIFKIIWSADEEKVVAFYLDNGATKKVYYNYLNNEHAFYDAKVGSVAWSPDSKKIAYQFTDPATGQSNVSVADPNGANWKNIFKTRLTNLIISWPTAQTISLQSQPSGLSTGFLFSLDSATGDFKSVLSDLPGLSAIWSPAGDKILYSKTDSNGKNPGLYFCDSAGQNNKNLNLAGLADKCVWNQSGNIIYCALPQQMSSNNIWPDDYYKGLAILSDDFYKIDLTASTKTKIAGSTNETGYDAQNLFLSPKGDYLFFTNKKDGLLYRIKL